MAPLVYECVLIEIVDLLSDNAAIRTMTTKENSTTYVLSQVNLLSKKGPSHSNSLKKS